MKILHVINTLRTGGAEKLLADIAPRLRNNGCEIDIVVFDGEDTYFKKKLIDAGINVISFSKNCNVYNPYFILTLRKIIDDYDIVHTHNTSPQFFTALASIFKRVKLVTTEHSTSNRRRGSRIFRLIDRWMYSRYSKVICISEQTQSILQKYLPSISSRLTTIYNGIDIDKYRNAKPIYKSSDKFVITMVAGFRYQKDHETAVRAFSYLDKNKYELWLVGDGNRRQEIENLIISLNLSDNIKLLGIRNDVPSILKASDVILQSSHIEGFGLAAVEGMAAGKPVIATNIPGLSQIVGSAGILVTHSDSKDITDAICRLQSDSAYYKSVSHKCFVKALEYDIENMVTKYIETYNKLNIQ